MLWVALLQLFLLSSICRRPEACQVGSDLHGALVGGENFDQQGLPAHSNRRGMRQAIEVLNTGREYGWCVGSIANTGTAAARQLQSLGSIFIEQGFLPWSQPRLEDGPYGVV